MISLEHNNSVSRAQLIGLLTFMGQFPDIVCHASVGSSLCDVSMHVHSGAELVWLESVTRPFLVDGCTVDTRIYGEFIVLRIEYPVS